MLVTQSDFVTVLGIAIWVTKPRWTKSTEGDNGHHALWVGRSGDVSFSAFDIRSPYMHDLSVDGFAERTVRQLQLPGHIQMMLAGCGTRQLLAPPCAPLLHAPCPPGPQLPANSPLPLSFALPPQVWANGKGANMNIDFHRAGE